MSGRQQSVFSCGLEGLSWSTQCLHLEKNCVSYRAVVSYFGSGECNKLLHFTSPPPPKLYMEDQSHVVRWICVVCTLEPTLKLNSCFAGIFECCSTPSAPGGQPLLRHSLDREKLGTNGSVLLSGLSIFFYWGDFCFCSHKRPTAAHREEALALRPEHYWCLGTILCNLPAPRLLIGSGFSSRTQPFFAVTMKNVSRHWWSLLGWGQGGGSPWFGVIAAVRQSDALPCQSSMTRDNYAEFLGWK